MKKSIFGLMALCLVFGLVLAGCPDGNKQPPTKIEWVQDSNGFIQFSTNDPKDLGGSYWNIYQNSSSDPNVYEIEVKKVSGYLGGGYGMLFGFVDNNNYYRLLITNNGNYSTAKRVNGTVTVFQSFVRSTYLTAGPNETNTLKVVYTPANDKYTVYLNDHNVTSFTDTSITGGTRIGFYVSISSQTNENFPGTPVDVWFRQK
jgi:hypothetical protein